MIREEIIRVLAGYRRPGSPAYARHYDRLPEELVRSENVIPLLDILNDTSLPDAVRDHAAGALGKIGDERAANSLIDALADRATRRGAATALGMMRLSEARDALAAVAPSVKAAAWALREIGSAERALRETGGGENVDSLMHDLRTEQLQFVRQRVLELDPVTRAEVERRIVDHLRRAVASGDLEFQRNAWAADALAYLAPESGADVVREGLHLCIDDPGEPRLTGHFVEAARAVGSPELVAPLADIACSAMNPSLRERAARAIRQIARRREAGGIDVSIRDRLARAAGRYEDEINATQPIEGEKPWDMRPGTPKWFAVATRALKEMRGLLRG